jgi:hypothetical protein
MTTSGMQMRPMLTPLERSAVSSLSAESRQKHGSEQSPWDGEDERERQNVSDEANEVFDRQVVINQEREELAKNVAEDEDETEDDDREEQVHNQLPGDVAIDDFHRSRLLVRFEESRK